MRLLARAAVIAALIVVLPVAAHAAGPVTTPIPILVEGFEATPTAWRIAPIDEPGTTETAHWGRVTQRAASGSYGLWCAGSSIADPAANGFTLWAGRYPAGTHGSAQTTLTALADYYSSSLAYRYVMPALAGYDSFNVGWRRLVDTAPEMPAQPLTSVWVTAGGPMSARATSITERNLSRTAGVIDFQLSPEAGGSAGGVEGPTIDDVAVTGFKYGPVRSLTATASAGAVTLAWLRPLRSTEITTAVEERPIAYRVYRSPDVEPYAWTEVTGARVTTESFVDTGAPAGANRYCVQAWDQGTGAGYGEVSIPGGTAVAAVPVPPVTTITASPAAPDGAAGWYVTTPTVTVLRTPASGSSWHRVDGGAWSLRSAASFGLTLLQGSHVFEAYSVSADGATETPPASLTVALDTAAPVTSSDSSGTYTGSAIVHLFPSDASGGSGLAGTRWAVDGSVATSGTASVISTPGVHTLTWSSADVAGNREATRSATVTVLSGAVTPVTASVVTPADPTGRNGWYISAPPTVQIVRTGDGTTYWGWGTPTTPTPTYAGSASTTTTAPWPVRPDGGVFHGEATLHHFGFASGAATEPLNTRVLRYDGVLPSGVVALNEGAASATTRAVSIDSTYTDAASGMAELAYTLDAGSNVTTLPYTAHVPVRLSGGNGAKSVWVRFADTAGNVDAWHQLSITLAVPPPVTTLTLTSPAVPDGAAGWYVTTPTLTVSRSTVAGLTRTRTDAGVWSDHATAPFTLTVLTGVHTYAAYTDHDGIVESPEVTRAISLDPVAPVTTASVAPTLAPGASIALSATDTVSGVASTRWGYAGGAAGSGSAAIAPSVPGTASLEFRSVDVAGNTEVTRTVTVTVVAAPSVAATITRVAGADRYEVAAAIARAGFKNATAAIVACGSDKALADPLTASGLAGYLNAPILLVRTDTRTFVPKATIDALYAIRGIKTVKQFKIHIVGGTASVTAAQAAELAKIGTVTRISGRNRYEVAANIAKQMRGGANAATASGFLIANGSYPGVFPDALAAGPVARARRMPILLVTTATVPAFTTAEAAKWTGTCTVIASAGAVEPSVIASLPAGRAQVLSGATRAELAAAVASHFASAGTTLPVGVVNALPDALAGGADTGRRGGVLLYTDATTTPAATDAYLAAQASRVGTVTVFGGTGSVSLDVWNHLKAVLGIL